MFPLRHWFLGFGFVLLTACGGGAAHAPGAPDDPGGAAGAGDDDDGRGRCIPDDQDGVVGGNNTVKLYITDESFNVGTRDSGQRNIAVQNSANVTLTIANVGTRPHGFTVHCRPTDLPPECDQLTSCFPVEADAPALEPGQSVTIKFKAPVVEGEYEFTSEEAGDDALVGEFVLM